MPHKMHIFMSGLIRALYISIMQINGSMIYKL